jgi:hypothetical protein
VTGQGQKVNIGFKVDLDVAHRFVAKVALSAGYLVYGDHFRKHVKHEDFRKIMKQRPTESIGDRSVLALWNETGESRSRGCARYSKADVRPLYDRKEARRRGVLVGA